MIKTLIGILIGTLLGVIFWGVYCWWLNKD